MDTAIQIVQIGTDQEDYINQIADMTVTFTDESSLYGFLDFNREKFICWLREYLDDPASVFAAVRDGKVMGYMVFFLDNNYIDQINLEMMTFYVAPQYRGTNAARMLAQAFVDTQDLNGCKLAQVSVCSSMKVNGDRIDRLTENMFKKHGFYQIGTILGRKGKSWA